jgi:hypothetical protein
MKRIKIRWPVLICFLRKISLLSGALLQVLICLEKNNTEWWWIDEQVTDFDF